MNLLIFVHRLHLPKPWAIMLPLASGNMAISTEGVHCSSSTSVLGIPDMFPVFNCEDIRQRKAHKAQIQELFEKSLQSLSKMVPKLSI